MASENLMHMPGMGGAWASWDAREHPVGALLIAGWWGGRLIRNQLEKEGLPVLELPVDYSQSFDGEQKAQMVRDYIEQRVIPAKQNRF